MAERKLYFYSLSGWETKGAFDAILTTSLSKFPHIDGCCCHKNVKLLVSKKNIGKKFKLSILDPFEIGEVTYLGQGTDAIPDEEIKCRLLGKADYINSWFYVFQTPDNELIICSSLDVEPLF